MLDPVKYLPQLQPGRLRLEQVVGDPMTPKGRAGKDCRECVFPGQRRAISGCAHAGSCMDDAELVA